MTHEEQLEHERHIAAIVSLRKEPRASESRLKTWLGSSVLTALIGVVGTGFVGTIVSGRIQDRARRIEFERQQLAARREAQVRPVTTALELVSTFMSTTDDLLVSIHEGYGEAGRPRRDVDALRAWKKELTQKRDAADGAWRRQERLLGYALRTLYAGHDDVGSTWSQLGGAIKTFEACSNAYYSTHAASGAQDRVVAICSEERAACDRAVDAFLRAVDTAQRREAAAVASGN